LKERIGGGGDLRWVSGQRDASAGLEAELTKTKRVVKSSVRWYFLSSEYSIHERACSP
jgi:hypothetical protein